MMFRKSLFTLLITSLLLAGCEPITLTLFGIGAATGVSYSLNGVAYKTFTVSKSKLHAATLTVFGRMGITIDKIDKTESKNIISGSCMDRKIEVILEAITPKATRMRTIAKKNALLQDKATATEIIIQTEKILEEV